MSDALPSLMAAAAALCAIRGWSARWAEARFGLWPARPPRRLATIGALARSRGAPVVLGLVGAALGVPIVGWVGAVIGGTTGAALPAWLHRRDRVRRTSALEIQLADLAGSMALAVRSGLSAIRAVHVAAEDAEPPIAVPLRNLVEAGRLGDAFEDGLERFAGEIDTDDARLFALVVELHAKTGGDLARALEEVAETIRHRVRVRRELRALSAQGRISGAVLGVLPIGFFLVLALTSRHDISPVITTPAGAAMVLTGLVMEALAFVWIRRLLRVEA
jgi:tight adherence protein B